ncbi:hypothetical protein DPMN_079948 [Dreissena polymorpha]|uniref:Uncharacterized protein n=1 Tax=Dreissena polymorpha TaxID=45954 RepID=A0A9D3YPY7_DREPO|nr:hypothetical protein DPMN_079948 [Dreissena polymorpha]
MGKCRFKPGWLTEYSWVQKTNDIRKAHCWVCTKTIDVGGMEESALKSHKKMKTLKENMKLRSKQGSWDVFFVKQEGTIVKTVKSKTDLKTTAHLCRTRKAQPHAESVQIEDSNSRTFATFSCSIKLADIHRQIRHKK